MWGKEWESAWGEWEVCWGVGVGEGAVGGGVGKCVGVWGEARKDVWGGVWESVWGEWGSVLASGERMWGEEWGKCREVY